MTTYLFQGVILPERAPLTLSFGLAFNYSATDRRTTAEVSIILNQVAVWVHDEFDWDVFDLRNVVSALLRSQISIVGFLLGHAYDFEVTRVLNEDRKIDYVFGIDIPCITKRNEEIDVQMALRSIQAKMIGPLGALLSRCFNDLRSAMKDAEDTGFYCYRAIESLRHHCAAEHKLTESEKSIQWSKFRGIANCDEAVIRRIKLYADPVRHGAPCEVTGAERERLFDDTWSIVGQYINNIKAIQPA